MMENQEKKEKLGRAVRELVDALNVRVAQELGLLIELETPTKISGPPRGGFRDDPDEQKYQVRIIQEINY